MKRLFFIIIIPFFLASSLLLAEKEKLEGGMLDNKVNSKYEDYGSYMIYGADHDTLIFTSSRPVPKTVRTALNAEFFYSIRPASYRKEGTPINTGWSQAIQLSDESGRISGYIRGTQAIFADRIIFAAERDLSSGNNEGTSYLLDLWEMTKRSDGYSTPRPLNEINDPDAWDSQPAFSQDGKTLYFISNRNGGSGGLDIWYSIRDAGGNWGKPLPVPNVNSPGDEFSPHCGTDGKFYFSSNWDFDKNTKGSSGKDIFRADYQIYLGLQQPSKPVKLDDAIRADAKKYGLDFPSYINYNSEADDEFPFITPDRHSIFLTSNRSADLDQRNIFAFSLPKSKIRLQVNVSERILDANGIEILPATIKTGLPLTIEERTTGATIDAKSGSPIDVDPDKTYVIKFSKFVEEECYQNKIEGPSTLEVFTKAPFGLDTIYYRDVQITRQKIEFQPIVFISTDTLPYFITGYWEPNTSENLDKFRQREAEGYFNETGFVDSTSHDYIKAAKRIDQSFSEKLFQPLEKILPLFQDFCRDTLYLKVTVHGYTDPRGLSAGNEHPYRPGSRYKRKYPGKNIVVGIDADGNPVKISNGIDMFAKSWNDDGKRIRLPDDGEEGNVLLSKLRAYFTFETFDAEMIKRSPIYVQLRDNNRVILDVEGFGIDKDGFKERNLRDDPQSRRIEIYLDILRPDEIASHKRLKKGIIKEIKTTQKQTIKETPKIETPKIDDPGQLNKESATVQSSVTNKKRQSTFGIASKPGDSPAAKPIEPAFNENQVASEPLLPTEKSEITPPQSDASKSCYSLEFYSYTTAEEANAALKTIQDSGLKEAHLVEIFDMFGNRTLRLRYGCYPTPDEAIDQITGLLWVPRTLNIDKRPYVVK